MPYCYEYPRPAITVDAAIFNKAEGEWRILLIRRGKPPFKGMWALPGGFVEMEETLEEAMDRELKEETGLENIPMEQLHTFSAVNRDPRHRTISTVFWGVLPAGHTSIHAGDDADETAWFPADQLPDLAFDHNEIIGIALGRLTIRES